MLICNMIIRVAHGNMIIRVAHGNNSRVQSFVFFSMKFNTFICSNYFIHFLNQVLKYINYLN